MTATGRSENKSCKKWKGNASDESKTETHSKTKPTSTPSHVPLPRHIVLLRKFRQNKPSQMTPNDQHEYQHASPHKGASVVQSLLFYPYPKSIVTFYSPNPLTQSQSTTGTTTLSFPPVKTASVRLANPAATPAFWKVKFHGS